jgi:hypothetical protein
VAVERIGADDLLHLGWHASKRSMQQQRLISRDRTSVGIEAAPLGRLLVSRDRHRE